MLIKKWGKKIAHNFHEQEQWSRLNRRLFSFSTDFMLPSEMEIADFQKKDHINVWFFIDVSGSCTGSEERFLRASKSLPNDKFKVRTFSFDTHVREIHNDKIYGGGGTCFQPIENYIQRNILPDGKYPYVFIVTDGEGSRVFPQYPDKWYWFLTRNCRRYIPQGAHVFELKDFE